MICERELNTMDSYHLKLCRSSAENQIMRDLINGVLLENVFDLENNCYCSSSKFTKDLPYLSCGKYEFLCFVWLVPNLRYIAFRAKSAILGRLQVSRLPICLVERQSSSHPQKYFLKPSEVLQELAEAFSKRQSSANIDNVISQLKIAIERRTLVLASKSESTSIALNKSLSFSELEHIAALRDRPFHPTAHAKIGWSEADYCYYSPELSSGFSVSWIAVNRKYLKASSSASRLQLTDILLDVDEKTKLDCIFSKIDKLTDYVLLPVHPWQAKHILPNYFNSEIKAGILIYLEYETGHYFPSSSIRSLIPKTGNHFSLKLPIGVSSLGGSREMPPRNLLNGEKGQRLLQKVITKNPWLDSRVYLADETNWWVLHRSKDDELSDEAGHLACLLRKYPKCIVNDPESKIVPMASLAAKSNSRSVWLWICRLRQVENNQKSVFRVFADISNELITTALTFASYGVLPELHGQNVLLVLRKGWLNGIMLRDHDTVRVYPPWMKLADLQNPEYKIKLGTRNNLILGTPEEFLSYFLTLAIQVNLYAIIDTLSDLYDCEELSFWKIIKKILQEKVLQNDLFTEPKEKMQDFILYESNWPFKQLLTPLLNSDPKERGMPSSLGVISNPLKNLN
jgi:siderophore synthetase component